MGVKILLADDSPTVHKVIKIILGSEPYEIVDCAREAELLPKLAQISPAIVFLDFNFSETQTGYDICRGIKQKSPATKVLMMYGTFDTVDEGALKECGVEQHVVKPFDTNRFIFQIRAMADTSAAEPADSWSVRESVERHSPDVGRMTDETVESLDSSLSDWGMNVPGVIGKSGGQAEFPPVIGAAAPVTKVEAITDASTKLPDDGDLEYPDLGSSLELEPKEKPKSRLIPLNELHIEDEAPAKAGSLELMSYAGMDDVKKIEAQIRDEVEADLWSVDSFEETNPRLAVVQPSGNTDHDTDHEEELSFSAAPVTKSTATAASTALDLESLRPLLKDLVAQVVREYCEQQVDKVAWEVIPDLAENLIRKELQNLASKALEDG